MNGRMNYYLISLLVFATGVCNGQHGAQYLRSAMRDLTKLKIKVGEDSDSQRNTGTRNLKLNTVDRISHINDDAPPISLTKGELAQIYESALHNGQMIKLDTGHNEYVHAAVHNLDEEHNDDDDDSDGYYYYYYPIKSFLDEMTSQASSNSHVSNYKPKHTENVWKQTTTYRPPFQYHSHNHQHNVTIKTVPTDEKKTKAIEPLFMAISGFIGMAVMFVLSVLVLPKFGIKPKTAGVVNNKEDNFDFAKLALRAIDGDCAERFACELSKTARTFNLQENRFVKFLKRLAPGTFGKHIDRVGKYTNKQLKCTAIPCKRTNKTNKKNYDKKNKKPVQKKQ